MRGFFYRNRILFSNVLKHDLRLFPTIRDKPREDINDIEAGSIHGVDKNFLSDIYETAAVDPKSEHLASTVLH